MRGGPLGAVLLLVALPAAALSDEACPGPDLSVPPPGATAVEVRQADVSSARFPGRWQQGRLADLIYRIYPGGLGMVGPGPHMEAWRIEIACDSTDRTCRYRSVGAVPDGMQPRARRLSACLLGPVTRPATTQAPSVQGTTAATPQADASRPATTPTVPPAEAGTAEPADQAADPAPPSGPPSPAAPPDATAPSPTREPAPVAPPSTTRASPAAPPPDLPRTLAREPAPAAPQPEPGRPSATAPRDAPGPRAVGQAPAPGTDAEPAATAPRDAPSGDRPLVPSIMAGSAYLCWAVPEIADGRADATRPDMLVCRIAPASTPADPASPSSDAAGGGPGTDASPPRPSPAPSDGPSVGPDPSPEGSEADTPPPDPPLPEIEPSDTPPATVGPDTTQGIPAAPDPPATAPQTSARQPDRPQQAAAPPRAPNQPTPDQQPPDPPQETADSLPRPPVWNGPRATLLPTRRTPGKDVPQMPTHAPRIVQPAPAPSAAGARGAAVRLALPPVPHPPVLHQPMPDQPPAEPHLALTRCVLGSAMALGTRDIGDIGAVSANLSCSGRFGRRLTFSGGLTGHPVSRDGLDGDPTYSYSLAWRVTDAVTLTYANYTAALAGGRALAGLGDGRLQLSRRLGRWPLRPGRGMERAVDCSGFASLSWSGSANAGVNCSLKATRRLTIRMTVLAYPPGIQREDEADFSYSASYAISPQITLTYSNYANNRWPWNPSSSDVDLLHGGSVGLSYQWSF